MKYERYRLVIESGLKYVFNDVSPDITLDEAKAKFYEKNTSMDWGDPSLRVDVEGQAYESAPWVHIKRILGPVAKIGFLGAYPKETANSVDSLRDALGYPRPQDGPETKGTDGQVLVMTPDGPEYQDKWMRIIIGNGSSVSLEPDAGRKRAILIQELHIRACKMRYLATQYTELAELAGADTLTEKQIEALQAVIEESK